MQLEPNDGLFETLEKISASGDSANLKKQIPEAPEGGVLKLTIPEGSLLLSNLLTLKILKKEAEKLGVELALETEDPRGTNLIAGLEGEKEVPASTAFGFREGVDIYPEAGQAVEEGGRKLMEILKSPWMKKFLLFSAVGLAGLGIVFILLWTVPKATVRLTVRSEALVQSFELTASPSASVIDREKRILPAVLIEVEEKGEQKAEATGKKEKGTKATGEVTIYNWTDDDETFAEEMVITLIRVEGEKLKFLLDEELTVPAQTASVSATPEERTTTYIPGKKNVPVTAEEFGEEYNIKAGSQFSIAGLSTDDFLAQNRDDFEGGKKEEVTVVTSEDQQRLLQRLKDELERRAREDIKSRTVGDQKLIEEAISYNILGQTFDKEVDEESEEFSLSLRLKGGALVYSQDQLDTLVSELLAGSVPEDFDLSDRDLLTEVSAAKVEESEDGKKMLKILTKTKASVVSKLDEDRIKKDLVGRSLGSAKNYLESVPGVSAVEITIFPPLPGPLTRMPRLTSRIDIVLKHD